MSNRNITSTQRKVGLVITNPCDTICHFHQNQSNLPNILKFESVVWNRFYFLPLQIHIVLNWKLIAPCNAQRFSRFPSIALLNLRMANIIFNIFRWYSKWKIFSKKKIKPFEPNQERKLAAESTNQWKISFLQIFPYIFRIVGFFPGYTLKSDSIHPGHLKFMSTGYHKKVEKTKN